MKKLHDIIDKADAIIITAGAGMGVDICKFLVLPSYNYKAFDKGVEMTN